MDEMDPTSNERLRIAYLCLQATTEGQASHAHVHEIIDGLRKCGYSVDLHEPRYAGRRPPWALGRFLEFARIQLRLIRRLSSYDVLYVRGHPLAYPTSLAAGWRKLTTIQECNGPYEDFVQAWPAARPFARMLASMARAQYRDAKAVVAVTPQLAEWVERDSGQRSVTVVQNGANVDLFAPGRPRRDGLPDRYAVFFGALQPWQGVRVILEATKHESWPADLPVVFVGDGMLAEEVRAAAAAAPDRVRYLGRLPYHDVPAVVSNAVLSLVGFSTEHRGASGISPLKLYESMAAGVAVVAGDIPGQAEVVREAGCGALVGPITPENLAVTVARLFADPASTRAMGERAREAAVARHSWLERAKQIDQVISCAVAPAASAGGAGTPRIAYVSLQAVVDGQDTWAAVTEITKGIEADGWRVDDYFPHYRNGTPPGPIGRLFEMSRIQLRLRKALDGYDAVYVRAHPAAWPIATIARRRGIPVVQECNGPYEDLFIAWPSTRLGRPLFEALQRSQYRGASAIVSVAEGLTDWLRDESGNPNIVTNGNGANVEVFTPQAPRRPGLPDRFAVFFGQFPAWQGITTLLEAVALPEWPDDLRLVFVGDGALRPAVEDAVASMPERVMYLGRLPYAEVAGVVAHAAVSYVPMVAPEREAKFSPLKLYESMACGVPVVASDTVGISEVVTATRCGLLVEPGDARGIVAATLELLGDPETAEAMGQRGREAAVRRFSWRARATQRRHVIEEAMGRVEPKAATA